jgi:predicted AlkP superfamily phosphohydrolase/phosphomutase
MLLIEEEIRPPILSRFQPQRISEGLMHPAKLLLIGFDGLDFSLVHKYGPSMPHFSRLREGGLLTRLASTAPPITPGAWASICSGVNPGRTGLLGFFQRRGYSFTPVALQRTPAKALWDYCAEQGISCGIVNVPWPGPVPEGVSFGVTGRFTSLETSPPDLKEHILRMGYRPEVHHPSEFSSIHGFLRFAFEQAEACTAVTRRLIEERGPAVCMVVYNLPDMALHAMLNERMIQKVYEQIDRNLGLLLPHGERHVVVSDHGINITRGPVFYFGEWLVREGLLVLEEARQARTRREDLGFLLRKILQRSGLSSIKKMTPQFLRNFLPPGIRYPAFLPIDHSRTRAFLGPGEYCDLFLNVEGREPRGTVPPDEAGSLLQDMACRLAELSGTNGYRPIRLCPSREIYWGEHVDQLPDAVIRDPGSWHLEPGLYGSGPLGPVDLKHEHNQDGVFLVAGPSQGAPQGPGQASLVDVLPTCLALAGLKVPRGLDGKCLIEAREGFSCAHYETALTRPSWELESWFSKGEEAEVMERLEKLGYL